jgi:hypothetical protein
VEKGIFPVTASRSRKKYMPLPSAAFFYLEAASKIAYNNGNNALVRP